MASCPRTRCSRLLGCRHRYDPAAANWSPSATRNGRTTVPGVLAVGDCCGLGGARAAEAEGAIAGAAAAGPGAGSARGRAATRRQRRFQAALWRLFAAPYHGLALADPERSSAAARR